MTGPEEPRGMAAQRTGLSAANWLRLGTSMDLTDIVQHILDMTVPRLADAAGVFVHERLLAGGDVAGADDGELVVRRVGVRFTVGLPPPASAFPDGEVVVFPAASPYGRCAATRRAVTFAGPDGQSLEGIGPDGREVLARYRQFLAVPMTVADATIGMLTFARSADKPAFADHEAGLAVDIAERAGACIANCCLLARFRRAASAFRRGLLSAEPASPPGLEVAGCCVAADGLIGGDWYDVVSLAEGRAGLIIGDVMGHGVEAAATMAQLRAAAHALAELEVTPAELLSRLDRTIAMLKHPIYATCAYAIIDPAGHYATIAMAGHLPPVLAMPDGTTRVPEIPPGLSLGLGTAVFGQARVRMPPGAILALFTDGLVETRTQPYDKGISVLRKLLADQHGSLPEVRDALVAALGRGGEDDVTLVLARVPRQMNS